MTDRKAETIDIGKGVQYAKVAARLAEFHKDNDECSVHTSCEFKEGYVLFSAHVFSKKGTFEGHSMAKVGGRQKQFEKQETIAVGRALAFAGYLASGDIACAEEMADLITAMDLNALKLKYAKVNADALSGLDRVQKQQSFSAWCLELIGEAIDYHDPMSWTRGWLDECWKQLASIAADVPFEE